LKSHYIYLQFQFKFLNQIAQHTQVVSLRSPTASPTARGREKGERTKQNSIKTL